MLHLKTKAPEDGGWVLVDLWTVEDERLSLSLISCALDVLRKTLKMKLGKAFSAT